MPYFVHLNNYAPFGLAGMYSSWTTPDGVEQATFTILTTQSGDTLADVSDRALVILKREDESTWLDPSLNDMTTVYNITHPYDGSDLIVDRVSDEIHSKKSNAPTLIAPVE